MQLLDSVWTLSEGFNKRVIEDRPGIQLSTKDFIFFRTTEPLIRFHGYMNCKNLY